MTVTLGSLLILGYGACLGAAQASAGTARLIPLVLLTRLLLMTPLLLPALRSLGGTSFGSEAQLGVAILVAGMSLRLLYQTLQVNVPSTIISAASSHPAVSALGFDFVISVMSFIAWNLTPTGQRSGFQIDRVR